MSSFDQLKVTFFEECSEALQQIEIGLTDLRDGHGSDDTINAVFRSVHSVKGGAGIFGFEDLIGFAHVFETVLDAMRGGKLAVTPEVVDILLPANDVLTDLIAMTRAGEAIPPGYGSETRAALERLLGQDAGGGSPQDDDPAAADFDGLDFMPIRADAFGDPPAADDGNGRLTYAIVFRPNPDMLRRANEPLFILRELHKLGELELVAETDRLPPLAEIEPDRAYIGWTGTLRTASSRAQIEEVFEFVAGDCELVITPMTPDPAPASESAPAAAPVFQAAAPAAPLAEHPAPSLVPGIAPEHSEPAATSRPASSAVAKQAATTMRVEVEKIDRVVNMVGELVISQAMLGQIVHNLPEEVSSRLSQVLEEVIHHTRELKDSVMSMRAQAIGAVFQRMPRLVRELAAKTGKKVHLEMRGETTEVDRSIIERLGDPLTHIIRNSIDHGIESPAKRAAAGKAEEGTISLSAEHRGGRIVVEVRDDGGGIDPDRVLKKAREKGLVSPDAVLSEDEINNLIFLPGFSTAETVSDISGRGVGMDVVRRNIQDVGGRISLKSERGRGMTLTLALPLTLAVMDGMVIKVGGETYVLPMSAIVECLRPSRGDIHNLMGGRGMLRLRGNLVPLVHLGDILDLGPVAAESEERVVIITDAGDGTRFGMIVDELCGHQQVVVKSMEESYGAVPGVAGATILGNGRVALILDVEKLSDIAISQTSSFAAARFGNVEPPANATMT